MSDVSHTKRRDAAIESTKAYMIGWGWAFGVLGLGGVLGLLSMLWLRALPESRRLAGGKR